MSERKKIVGFLIVNKQTKSRFCKDNRFRTIAFFGSYPECVKVYKTRGWAAQKVFSLSKTGIEASIISLHSGDRIDAKGKICCP